MFVSLRSTAAAVLGTLLLTTVLHAQQWTLQRRDLGPFAAAVILDNRVAVLPAKSGLKELITVFGGDPAAWSLPPPGGHEMVVTSAGHAQAARVIVTTSNGTIISRYQPMTPPATWRIERQGLPEFVLSDNGATIVAVHIDIHTDNPTTVAIHGREGQLVTELRRPNVRSVRVSADGSLIALLTGTAIALFNVEPARVTPAGELPWAPEVELSDTGRFVAAAGEDGVLIHQRQDQKVSADPIGRIESSVGAVVAFDPSESFAVIAQQRRMWLFDVNARTQTTPIDAPPDGFEYRSMDLSGGAALVAAGTLRVDARRSRTSPGAATAQVALFSRTGALVSRNPIELTEWGANAPAVTFFDRDRQLLITSPASVHVLSLPAIGK